MGAVCVLCGFPSPGLFQGTILVKMVNTVDFSKLENRSVLMVLLYIGISGKGGE